MKKMRNIPEVVTGVYERIPLRMLIIVAFVVVTFTACNKKEGASDPAAMSKQSAAKLISISPIRPIGNFEVTNLVSDVSGMGAARTDGNLVDAWGIAFSPEDAIWIASNHKGLSAVYNEQGGQVRPPVDIPFKGIHFGSSPDGVVYNYTPEFRIPTRFPEFEIARFIFSTEDAIISAWSSGDTAVTMIDRSAMGAIYKGITIASNNGHNYIYATNFGMGTVDVFDGFFHYANISFSDPSIPTGYAPFNIRNIDGQLFVTYALKQTNGRDDQPGIGHGYIDIFNPDGSLVRRFASQGQLNSPWGITETEPVSGNEYVLVGNFGDGRINVFDEKGLYLGVLASGTTPIVINGLWALSYQQVDEKFANHVGRKVFFTAGPDQESHGLFGVITRL